MLSERRLHLKLVQVYKILHGLCDFPDILQIQFIQASRLARARTLHCPFTRTNYYYNSFIPSSFRAWNLLEEDLVPTLSLQSFKLAVKWLHQLEAWTTRVVDVPPYTIDSWEGIRDNLPILMPCL